MNERYCTTLTNVKVSKTRQSEFDYLNCRLTFYVTKGIEEIACVVTKPMQAMRLACLLSPGRRVDVILEKPVIITYGTGSTKSVSMSYPLADINLCEESFDTIKDEEERGVCLVGMTRTERSDWMKTRAQQKPDIREDHHGYAILYNRPALDYEFVRAVANFETKRRR